MKIQKITSLRRVYNNCLNRLRDRRGYTLRSLCKGVHVWILKVKRLWLVYTTRLVVDIKRALVGWQNENSKNTTI